MEIIKFNFKEYEEQDLMCKRPMRRRYDELKENYEGYLIYKYIRGEYTRYSVEDENGKIFLETDNIEEAKGFSQLQRVYKILEKSMATI